jgi:hypothetical protein
LSLFFYLSHSLLSTSKQPSDGWVLFPLWPAGTISGLGSSADELRIARASVKWYAKNFTDKQSIDCGWCQLVMFPAAVRAGAAAAGQYGFSATEILEGLNKYLRVQMGPNMLPYAPGGGTENVGLAHAVNEMLVQTVPQTGEIVLFPVWPQDEDASFQRLRVKGGFLVSAAWEASARTVTHISVEATTDSTCLLRVPFASPKIVCSPPQSAQVQTMAVLGRAAGATTKIKMLAAQTCQVQPAQ